MHEESTRSPRLTSLLEFLKDNGLETDADAIGSSGEKFGSYDWTLKRVMALNALERNGLLHKFINEEWPYGATPGGEKELTRLGRIFKRYQRSKGESVVPVEETPPSEEPPWREEHLRDYLAQHLGRLEEGLKLWPLTTQEDAVEYPVDGRRIDILAQDNTGTPVVIELKVSRGHERTIGQALLYRGKIKELFKVSRVRVFIVAWQISPELRIAAQEAGDISLFQYQLSVSVQHVESVTAGSAAQVA
jgi:hypothetical protein